MPKRILPPSTALYPVPVVLVSCGDVEHPNIITIAWTGVINSDPPTVSIAIRPSRYSHSLVRESQEFVVNIPTSDQLEYVDYCGIVSGREIDKFEACGFTPIPASSVNTALIAQCPINIECTVKQTITLGTHDMFVGQIEAVQGEEAVMNERGRIDPAKAVPLAYVSGNYYELGSYLNKHGFTGGKLAPIGT
jgi:flavin reductase (DIM6/NTAB) family NADH-FMN oxidoreductase RutF